MAPDAPGGGASKPGRALPPAWPMFTVCAGALLPWAEAGRSGILGDGRFAFALGTIGLLIYALERAPDPDLRWWRASSVPLTLGCLTLSALALKGYGALGALVTAAAAVTWLVMSRRAA